MLPELRALQSVEAIEPGRVAANIELLVVDDRRAVACLDAAGCPDERRLAVLHLAGIDANYLALRRGADVLLAMADVDQAALHDRRSVDNAIAELVLPDRLAGTDFQRVYMAVRGA